MAEQTKTRILYLDDNQNHIADFLRVFGDHYEVFTTGSEKEGLQLAIQNDIGVIVINESMLEKECADILKSMKAEDPGIPIIAIQPGEGLQFDTINGEKGAAAFILKPFIKEPAESNNTNQQYVTNQNPTDEKQKENDSESSKELLSLEEKTIDMLRQLQEDADRNLPGDQLLTNLIAHTALLVNSSNVVLYIENCPDCYIEKLTVKSFIKTQNDVFTATHNTIDEGTFNHIDHLPSEVVMERRIHWQLLDSNEGLHSKHGVSDDVRGILRIPVCYGVHLYAIMEFYTRNDYTNKTASLKILSDFGIRAGYVMDRKRLEAELRRAKDESEAANKAKSVFLANMSHELRTPLNAVLGFSQVLQKQYFGALNEKQLEYVNDIVESGRHLLSLINDILDLSKVEAGKMELELSRISIREWLEHSMLLIREKSIRHGIDLKLEMDDALDLVEFVADERKMKQVMFNLLTNASKFTPDGGEITIVAKLEGELVKVCISDTGIGISDEDKNMIFEKFYKTKSGKMLEAAGSGLGLPLVKSFVEKHGGKIWVESEGEDKGSKFTFMVPLKQ